eukprot:TRINITY_DN2957_c0_g1_i1.p1 TRINITY_DN2957_c0_g1~~TRINITY_DN2957_c0_g1_i1.p1  ORF type:complete len:360 (+),score=51.40 TRINITY_DN2957_c0_g1_i1:39-1118(+)
MGVAIMECSQPVQKTEDIAIKVCQQQHHHQHHGLDRHYTGSVDSFADEGSSREDSSPMSGSLTPWWYRQGDSWYVAHVLDRYEKELQLNTYRNRTCRAPLEYISCIERQPIIGIEDGAPSWLHKTAQSSGFKTCDKVTVKGLCASTEPITTVRIVCWDDDGLPANFYEPPLRQVGKLERYLSCVEPTYLIATPTSLSVRCQIVYEDGVMVPHKHTASCGFEWNISYCEPSYLPRLPSIQQLSVSVLPVHSQGAVAAAFIVVITAALHEAEDVDLLCYNSDNDDDSSTSSSSSTSSCEKGFCLTNSPTSLFSLQQDTDDWEEADWDVEDEEEGELVGGDSPNVVGFSEADMKDFPELFGR